MYLSAPFIAQNLRKVLEPIQSYEDVPFSVPKWPVCPKEIFLVKTIKITFIYLLAPFSLQNVRKILWVDPELWGCAIFGLKSTHLTQTIIFWEKLLIFFLSIYWPLSLCKSVKKLSQRILSYKDAPLLCPN